MKSGNKAVNGEIRNLIRQARGMENVLLTRRAEGLESILYTKISHGKDQISFKLLNVTLPHWRG